MAQRNIVSGMGSNEAASVLTKFESLFGRLRVDDRRVLTQNQSISLGDVTDILLRRAQSAVPEQVVGLITESYVSPYTEILLPHRVLGYNESTLIKWKEVAFQGGIMPIGERRSKGRTYTYNETEHNETVVRRQAAIEIESDFYSTPEGIERWVQKVHQIATLIVTTEEHDVMLTILESSKNRRIRAQDMNAPTNRVYGNYENLDKEREMREARDIFCAANKVPNGRGLVATITDCKHQMKARFNVTPDTIIVPPYLKSNYMMKDDNWHAYSAGDATADNRRQAAELSTQQYTTVEKFMGMNVVDSSLVRAVPDTDGTPADLLTVKSQIGECYPMEISSFYPDVADMTSYLSTDRNVEIFNEDQGRFTTVTYLKALENSMRFSPDGDQVLDNLMHQGVQHDMFVAEANIPRVGPANNPTFEAVEGGSVVSHWWHVSEEYLNTDSLMRVVQTLKNSADPDELTALVDLFGLHEAQFTLITGANLPPNGEGRVAFNDCQRLLAMFGTDRTKLTRRSNQIVFNGPLERFENFPGSKEEKCILSLFLHSKICMKNIRAMIKSNVFVPINILLARPWMTYYMSSVVLMKAGRETGETVIGRQTFDMSSNTGNGTISANYSGLTKAIVYRSENILVIPRIFCQGYKCGNNVNFVTRETIENQVQKYSGVLQGNQSLLPILMPAHTELMNTRTWMDIRGRSKYDGEDVEEHFPCADFVRVMCRIDEKDVADPATEEADYDLQTCRPNTTCWLGHMYYGKKKSMVQINTGHLGKNTYDQVNESRSRTSFAEVIPQQIQGRNIPVN